MLKVVVGRIIDYYHRLNPEQRPSILFAPGVEESRWFTEQFNLAGIPWSHIDSKQIILNGEEMAATQGKPRTTARRLHAAGPRRESRIASF